MSLKVQIAAELASLANGAAPAAGQEIRIVRPEGLVVVRLTAVDRLACAVESLRLETPRLASASIDNLKLLSDKLSKQLSYLLGPIALIECDADSATVQLRSSPPAKDDDQTSYYEIVARRGGEVALCRYLKQPDNSRQVTPANLTHEVVGRLAQDFVDAV